LEIDHPYHNNLKVEELGDYPPRIALDLMPPCPTSPAAVLVILGMKDRCSFTVQAPGHVQGNDRNSQFISYKTAYFLIGFILANDATESIIYNNTGER
jgi:hypothetical protein